MIHNPKRYMKPMEILSLTFPQNQGDVEKVRWSLKILKTPKWMCLENINSLINRWSGNEMNSAMTHVSDNIWMTIYSTGLVCLWKPSLHEYHFDCRIKYLFHHYDGRPWLQITITTMVLILKRPTLVYYW